MEPSNYSLELLRDISSKMREKTFHHHSHILFDLPIKENAYYVEIGCFAGGTACLMLQKKSINVISIDLGYPISPDIVKENVDLFNVNNNSFEYIQGNSHDIEVVNKLKQLTPNIDLLFIDGDHSFRGVLQDFSIFENMVTPGGWIVFDDYNDEEHSPEVKPAVDTIVKQLNNYEIFGTYKNTLGARPHTMLEGNCFVIRKNL